MAVIGTYTIDLTQCPACGSAITARASTKIKLGEWTSTDKTIPATVTITGLSVQHDCTPKVTR